MFSPQEDTSSLPSDTKSPQFPKNFLNIQAHIDLNWDQNSIFYGFFFLKKTPAS